MRIKEFAEFAGVSVRTLHYYDEIGILKPAFVDKFTGYRFYDEKCLERMQEILFYRELDFSLKSIREILSSPEHDTKKSLAEQKALLMLKKERLERLISAIDDAMKGENVMSAFDNSEFEKYKSETKEKWGKTAAFEEYEKQTSGYNSEKWGELSCGMKKIFDEFALCKNEGEKPSGEKAQNLCKSLQDFITENYYTCTKEIFSGLGKMYSADERFAENINRSGKGTAEFVSAAIEYFCR